MRMLTTAVALAILAALLLTLPAQAGATPSGVIAPAVSIGDTLDAFGKNRDCLGVSASDSWLYQARIQGMSLNLRLYQSAERILFEEDLARLDINTKEMRLSLRATETMGDVTLEIDQLAVDRLTHFGVTELVVTDAEYGVLAVYPLADIQTLRDGLSLADGELLCLSGPDNPVTVVSEDGIRRMIE